MKTHQIFIALLILLSLCACKDSNELRTDGLKSFPSAQKFDKLFSNAHHSVGKYGGPGEPKMWMSKALVHDRYVIKIEFDVSSPVGGGIKKTSPLKLYISEYSYRDDPKHGKQVLKGGLAELTEAQWAKVTTIDDIFTLAGVTPVTDQPIAELKAKGPKDW